MSKVITSDDFSGNYIHFGVRENAMAAISNGLVLSGFEVMCGTFLVFSDYMRPSIRLSAIMNLNTRYIMTHDSIGVGEDGATHQPIEHLSSLRAIPGINLYRPASGLETIAAIRDLLDSNGQSIIALTRQKIDRLDSNTTTLQSGAYVISYEEEKRELDFTVFASGSEVNIALKLKRLLKTHNFNIRVISVVCFDKLALSDHKTIKFFCNDASHLIAIEAGIDMGWHKIIGKYGNFYGLSAFGTSGKGTDLYEYYSLTADKIAKQILIDLNSNLISNV